MCYKHSLYLKASAWVAKQCARARCARTKRLCSSPQKTCYKCQHNTGLIFHRENLSDFWHTSCVHWKETGQHFTRSRLVLCSPSYSSSCPFWMVPVIESKTLQSLDKHVLVLTSLLRSVTPQEPGGFIMRAITATVREQQEQAGQAQPCPQHSWGGDHSPELKCSSTAKILYSSFSHG